MSLSSTESKCHEISLAFGSVSSQLVDSSSDAAAPLQFVCTILAIAEPSDAAPRAVYTVMSCQQGDDVRTGRVGARRPCEGRGEAAAGWTR